VFCSPENSTSDVFVAGGDLHVLGFNGVETDFLDAVGSEIDARAVLSLIGEAG
jgi:hypothetical protein